MLVQLLANRKANDLQFGMGQILGEGTVQGFSGQSLKEKYAFGLHSLSPCDQPLLSASHTQSCLVYVAPLHVWVLTNEVAHRFRQLTLLSRSISVNKPTRSGS